MPRSTDVRTFLLFAIVYVAMIVMLLLENTTDRHSADRSQGRDSTSATPTAVLTTRIVPEAHSTRSPRSDQSSLRP